MALFTTNENLPIQEQINMLTDQLNMVMSNYQQTKSGLVYYGNGNMPAGSKIQIYEDDSYGAENLTYDDSQTVLNAQTAQKALEKISADLAGKNTYAVRAIFEELEEDVDWFSFERDSIGNQDEAAYFYRFNLVKVGRVATLDIKIATEYTKRTFDVFTNHNLFIITKEDLKPLYDVPVPIYTTEYMYNEIIDPGSPYRPPTIIYNIEQKRERMSESGVLFRSNGRVDLQHVEDEEIYAEDDKVTDIWVCTLSMRTIYITAK